MKIMMSPENGWPAESFQQGIVRLAQGPRPVIFVSDAELARTLLAAPKQVVRDPLYRRAFGMGLGRQGLTTTIEQEWRDLRHVLAPIFRPAGLASMVPAVCGLTRDFLGHLAGETCVDLQAEMNGLTLVIIHQTLFGEKGVSRIAPELLEVAKNIAEASRQKSLARAIAEIATVADWVVSSLPVTPMIAQSPFARDNPADLGPEELLANVRLLLDAGHETTATNLTWALLLLGQRPAWQARLRDEIAAVVGEGPVSADHFERMPQLRATINETLRLYPSAPIILRRNLGPFALTNGDALPGDAHLAISLYAMQRRPDYWERPDDFDPERWLDAAPNPAFIPFGAGMHKCVGMAMSLMQISAILTEILRTCELQTLTEDAHPAMMVTLHPDRPVAVQFRSLPRRPSGPRPDQL